MPKIEHTFKNKGLGEYNDDVLNHPSFSLRDSEYQFKIRPSSKTDYWRFGIVMSMDEEFEFEPNKGRYANSTLKFLELDVGDRGTNGIWEYPNKLYLGCYYLNNYTSPISQDLNYVEHSPVEIYLKYDINEKLHYLSYSSQNIQQELSISIGDYPYFKLFAWADYSEFEINCLIEIPNQTNRRTGGFILKNNPDENLLDSEKLVNIFKELIINAETDDEQFFAVFGKWGRGKTYFWKLLRDSLSKLNQRYIFHSIEFHAWKYQDTPGIWAYLYENISHKYYNLPDKWYRFKDWFAYYKRLYILNSQKDNFRISILNFIAKIFIGILGYIFILNTKLFPLGSIITTVLLIPISLYSIIYYIGRNYKQDAKKILLNLSEKTSFEFHLGLQHEIQKELVYLLKAWLPFPEKKNEKIILFIDDIDRCSEDKIIQIVDYIRVLLHHEEIQKRMKVVAAIDERILLQAIENKYQRFINKTDNYEGDISWKKLGREYLDKLFIVSIKLGPLIEAEKEYIVKGFTNRLLNDQNLQSGEIIEGTNAKKQDHLNEMDGRINENLTSTDKKPIFEENEDESNFLLEKWEQEFISTILSGYDITPRSIRVFIFRYLLGKQLIEKPLGDNSAEFRIWSENETPKKYFASLLLQFSFLKYSGDLEIAYAEFLQNAKLNEEISEDVTGKNFRINKQLASIIYQVLTMIVPY